VHRLKVLIPVSLLFAAPLVSSCIPSLTLVVTSTADAADAHPGDGRCATATDDCTLRAAVQEADARQQAVDIDLDDGATYALTIAGAGEDAGATGDLDTSGPWIKVHGHGSVVDGAGLDRVFDQHGGVLDLDELTIRGGSVPSGGGGIRSAGTLNLTSDKVQDNTTTGTTGPYGIGIQQDAGSLNLVHTEVFENNQQAAFGGTSGAIYQAGGNLVVLDSSIHDNASTVDPDITPGSGTHAGIYQAAGSAVLANTTVAGQEVVGQACGPSPMGVPVCIPVTFRGFGIFVGGHADVKFSGLNRNTIDVGGTGSAKLGANQVGSCLVTTFDSYGFNRFNVNSCSPFASDQAPFAQIHDQIPVGWPLLCDGTTLPDVNDVSRPQGPACDVGPAET
jgi:CSLREA domain-containing protein